MKTLVVRKNDATIISPWYYSAVVTALIGGVFFVIILTLIITKYFQAGIYLPRYEEQLQALKDEMRIKPDNQELLSHIRRLDLQVRRYRLTREDFSDKGSLLLLGSSIVLLLGIRWMGTFKKTFTPPRLHPDLQERLLQEASSARLIVYAILVLLISGTIFFSLWPAIDFERTDVVVSSLSSEEDINKNWPNFRGPGALGIIAYKNVPTNWNGETGEGIIWKAKVPLPGYNSPIVWGERIFLSGATGNNLQVYCFDALSGNLLWQGDVPQGGSGSVKVPEEAGYAAPTVVTNGRRVCAIFRNR